MLDKAMEFHAGLSFESYDRLFSNQDVLPVGGFGNLIALPLQHAPRQQGNSVFIDEKFELYFDQWVYLLSTKKLTNQQLEVLLSDKQDLKQNLDREPWALNFVKEQEIITGYPVKLT